MKNIFNLAFITAFCLTPKTSYAQANSTDEGQIFIFKNLNEFCALKAEGMKYDSVKNTYSIGFIQDKVVTTLNQTGIFVHGTKSEFFKNFARYTFSKDLKLMSKTNEKYIPNAGDIKSLDTLIMKNPDFFNKKSDKAYSFANDVYGTNAIPYIYDNSINEYVKSNDKPIFINVNNKPEDKMLPSLMMATDEDNGTVTTYFERKGEEKYSELKNLMFVTYNLSGQVTNSFDVKFNYPRGYNTSGNVHDKNNFHQLVGKAFFFSKAQILFGAKKYGDPENNNFELVYCDNYGKLILHKTFKIKLEKRTELKIYYMLGDGNSISILAGYIGSSDVGVAMMNFTADGKESIALNSRKTFKSKKILDPSAKSQEENFNNPVGLSIGQSDDFTISGHKILTNNNLLIWGITSHSMDDPNYVKQPGTMVFDIPQIKYYHDLVCLQFNDTLGLKTMFVNTMNHTTDMAPVEVHELNNSAFLFATANMKSTAIVEEMNIREIASIIKDQKYKYEYKSIFAPRLVKIDLAAQKITEYNSVNKDFSLFRPIKYYCIEPDKKGVNIFGYYTNMKDQNMELFVEEIIFK
jgi:hypothetical protein